MSYLRIALLTALWYAANLIFNVGMKRSFKALPNALALTTLQLGVGALALAPALLVSGGGGAELTALLTHERRRLALAAALFLGGTLCTNFSLNLLSISFVQVVKVTEPIFSVALC